MSNSLTPAQLAMRWSISESTLSNWRSKGIGPVFLKMSSRVMYREEDIQKFEEQCLRKSTSEKADIGGAA